MNIVEKLIKFNLDERIEDYKLYSFITKKFDYYESYMKIIKKIVILLKELNKTNPIDAKIIYEYLLYNGYLSINKKFTVTTENRVLNHYIPGTDIMHGSGVCININELLKRIYEELGYISYILTCKLNSGKSISHYTPDIKQNIGKINLGKYSDLSLINTIKENIIGNHLITLVNDSNKIILCDAANLDFINLNKNLKGEFLFKDVKTKLLPNYMGLLENNLEELKKELLKTEKIDLEKVKILYENNINFCKNNINLLNDFHEDIKNDIEIVCKTLK